MHLNECLKSFNGFCSSFCIKRGGGGRGWGLVLKDLRFYWKVSELELYFISGSLYIVN